MKVAILADAIMNRGGVERIILEQAKLFGADIYVGRYNSGSTFKEFKKLKVHIISPNRTNGYGSIRGRLSTLLMWYNFSKLQLNYDYYIFHGTAVLNASKKHHPNLWYCHSPSRYLYDLYQEEYQRQTKLNKLLFLIVTYFLRRVDQKNVAHLDTIVTNSKNIQKRVKRYYNRNSEVLYPFVDLKKFKWISQEEFYLSTARLDAIKRVDLLVKAFQKMPKKGLIIASSGPEYNKIQRMAKKCKNIVVLGWVNDEKLRELYGKCIATFSVSYKEDFGIIPIESMACGKPCIATNEGGHKETIIQKETGLLIKSNIQEIIGAVKWMTPERAKKLRNNCEKRAKKFSEKRFIKEIKKEINKLVK